MILLSGQTLTPKRFFTPERMSLTLTDTGVSTANMTIGPDAPAVAVGDWMKDETDPGAGIVWRVRSVETDYDTDTRTVALEHVIATLKDGILFGEITTKDISGRSGSATAEQAARYILNRQSVWALGDFDFNRSLPYNFNNAVLFDALETVSKTLEDWCWEYDLTALPFRLHVRKKSADVGCELRTGRNITSIKKTVDKSGMYTRFYPVGEKNIHISGDYVSKNESVYGVISKTETDQSINNRDLLKSWAKEKLARHCEPTVTITISGVDMSAATGERLDRIRLGMVCRVPLPEFGTTITERVKKLAWTDKINEPTRFTATLANQLQDVASIIKALSTSGARNSAGGARTGQQVDEDHAWIVDTDTHVGLVAEALGVPKSAGGTPDWSRVSEIMVDGKGIAQRVTYAEGELVTHEAKITMNERSIAQEVTSRAAADRSLSARIALNANRISIVVKDTEDGFEVDSASIVAGINSQTGSYVKIKAKTIDLDGYVTVAELNTQKARIDNLLNGTLVADKLSATAARLGNSNSSSVYIYGQQVRVYSVVDTAGNTHHVYGYT